MKPKHITNGSRTVVIQRNHGLVIANLYFNNGVLSVSSWHGKTVKGAEVWAARVLSD